MNGRGRRPRAVGGALLALFLVVGGLLLSLRPGLAAPVPLAPPRQLAVAGENCLDAEEQAMLNNINAWRAQNGLSALRASATLSAAANNHSTDMANNNYFSHTLSNGTTWDQNIRNFGYAYNTYIGENIAAGYADAANTFNQWKNSPPHNANMLSANYTAIGIARAYNPNSTYKWYWTTDFGGVFDSPAALCGSPPPPAPTPTPVPPAPTPTSPPSSGGGVLPIVGSWRTSNSNSSTYAYDGNLGTMWYASGTPSVAYVAFDLGSPKTLSTIKWVFGYSGYADLMLIQVSSDGASWQTIAAPGNAPAGVWQSLRYGGSARYVRFYFQNPYRKPYLGSLAEVQFLG